MIIAEIFSSSFAAAAYFEKFPLSDGKKVYVIGQEGIGEELVRGVTCRHSHV